jgi:hypothetical protein
MTDDERIPVGVRTVQTYLETEFPGAPVEVLKPTSWDQNKDILTFKLQDGAATIRLLVVEKVLVLDSALVDGLLREKKTAETLRRHPGQTLLLTPNDLDVEPF